ncbi:unnamed protein product [Dibothriocephalus latus]|uniref:Uncharacterized protein n=1 Tax=Dibothriocephalus latus TaxID=60516 RepID=A0A3P7LQB8_DIBLA|nr:unnamed protein product [Dibothriocephalus latus]
MYFKTFSGGLQALIRWTFIKDWPLLLDDLHEDIWMNFMHDTMLEDTCMCDCKDNSGLLTHGIRRRAGSKEVAARQVGDCRMSSVVLNSISVMMVPGMFVTFLTQLTLAEKVNPDKIGIARQIRCIMKRFTGTQNYLQLVENRGFDVEKIRHETSHQLKPVSVQTLELPLVGATLQRICGHK